MKIRAKSSQSQKTVTRVKNSTQENTAPQSAGSARYLLKFESCCLDWLGSPYPQEEARYRERSPITIAAGHFLPRQ
jgi:hypothetical protein